MAIIKTLCFFAIASATAEGGEEAAGATAEAGEEAAGETESPNDFIITSNPDFDGSADAESPESTAEAGEEAAGGADFESWKTELCEGLDYPASKEIATWLNDINDQGWLSFFIGWGEYASCEELWQQYPSNIWAGATCNATWKENGSVVGESKRKEWETEAGCTKTTTTTTTTGNGTTIKPNPAGSASTLGFSALAVLLVATA